MKRKQSKSNSLLLYIFLIIISSYHLPCALHAENLNQNTTFENEIDLYRAKMRNYNPIDAIDYSVAQMNQSTDDRLIDESIHNILEYSINPNKYGELIIALQKLENKNTLSHANRSLAYLARQYFISFQDKDYAYDCLIKNAFSDEPHKDSFSILIKTFNVHNDISSIIKYTYLSSKTDGDIFDFSEIFCWLCYWKSKHLESEASEAFQSILLEADIEDQPAFSILFSIIDQLGQQKVKPNNPSNSIASLNGTSENALLLNSLRF